MNHITPVRRVIGGAFHGRIFVPDFVKNSAAGTPEAEREAVKGAVVRRVYRLPVKDLLYIGESSKSNEDRSRQGYDSKGNYK